jgi:hypothetical protein
VSVRAVVGLTPVALLLVLTGYAMFYVSDFTQAVAWTFFVLLPLALLSMVSLTWWIER